MPHHIQITSKKAVLVDSGVTFGFKEPLNINAFQADMERLVLTR
ncbi:MAG: hypothetical protein QME81_17940 [bacterium]|nr:hypothetical protein [bacterium]